MIAAVQHSMTQNMNSIADTIERALDSAGLDRDTPARQRIQAALTAAGLLKTVQGEPGAQPRPSRPPHTEPPADDRFTRQRHTSRHGARDYRLYVPRAQQDGPRPLIVMLHGCKQTADDFARGTRINELAERHGFIVAYPEQTRKDNGSNCWNWFEPAQQGQAGPEPALIAGIVADIAAAHSVDPRRVYVAGLSAGAAMAVLAAQAHPEVFAAVAAHSGLPAGAAHDVASAFEAMHGRAPPIPARGAPARARPTIVFHGDADRTVVARNGAAIAARAADAFERDGEPLQRLVRLSARAAGGTCTVTEHSDAQGRTQVEEWVVHGGGHAWFGGSPEGSYTEVAGPDASAEIVRFFLQHGAPRA
jgi:poly(hydroxyalkanoate) depolymerase family esterase